MKPDDHSKETEAGFFPIEVDAANPAASPTEADRPVSTPRMDLSAR